MIGWGVFLFFFPEEKKNVCHEGQHITFSCDRGVIYLLRPEPRQRNRTETRSSLYLPLTAALIFTVVYFGSIPVPGTAIYCRALNAASLLLAAAENLKWAVKNAAGEKKRGLLSGSASSAITCLD